MVVVKILLGSGPAFSPDLWGIVAVIHKNTRHDRRDPALRCTTKQVGGSFLDHCKGLGEVKIVLPRKRGINARLQPGHDPWVLHAEFAYFAAS